MKAIIDGRRYDTEKAEEIFSWSNGRYASDFRHRVKVLYRTSKGALFIFHAGGPMTDMAVPDGNNGSRGNTSIEPISNDDAFRFLCSHGGEEEAEAIFPERIEDA